MRTHTRTHTHICAHKCTHFRPLQASGEALISDSRPWMALPEYTGSNTMPVASATSCICTQAGLQRRHFGGWKGSRGGRWWWKRWGRGVEEAGTAWALKLLE